MSPRNTVLVLFALCLAAACAGAPDDPAEQVDEIRSGYTAQLNGLAVRQVPLTEELAEPGAEATAEEGAAEGQEAAAAGAAEEAGEEVPVRQDVILDILMSRSGRESLPAITVDIEHVGPKPDREVKDTYRAYIDTSEVLRGPGTQVVHRLEDVDYEQGDAFYVEVRHPVPPEERGEYREFQESQDEGQP